ncbi:MAG: glycoside hydrolase [Verrucomicrobiota bacterium]|nr:glycoside hydrolase [Verrucomicrobiota bacterium]
MGLGTRWASLMRMVGFACAVLLVFRAADAQTGRDLKKERLEKMDDPPMYIFRTDSSPQMISSFNGFTSYQVNVDANGNNIVGDAANEPSLAVDPTTHNRMAVGWRQFNSVASNFRQSGRGFSANGGATWSSPGVLEPNVFRSDPVLASDEAGRFFYLSLLQSFYDDMWRSLDGGVSWTDLAPATGGDKQWFTIDRTNSSGHGFQYQYWSTAGNNYNGRQFSRSTDGGFTWLDPIYLPRSAIWGTLDVDSDGNLFLVGVSPNSDQIWCERSTDAKNAAVIPTFDLVTPVSMGGVVDSSRRINPEGLVGQLYVGVDRSGSNTNNNVYLLGSLRTGVSRSDVMFVRSTNRGQSFSSPQRINDDPPNPNKWHWLAALGVAPNGRIDAVWLDSRNAANDLDSQLFYSYSLDGGVTWSRNVAASAPFNPLIGYPKQNKIGDYISIVSDSAGADVAYCGTFNGEEDVYYVRLTPQTSQLESISTRARILTGDNVLIAGFEVAGSTSKQILIRGIGPSLAQFGLTGLLADPTLTLNRGSTLLASNDNWKTRPDGTSQEAEVRATNRAPDNDQESAILATLSPGAYTAIVSGSGGGTGMGLVQVYDLTTGTTSELSSLSTRGYVDTNDNVLIGGINISGGDGGGSRVVLRAIGPSLSTFGVQGVLADPTLALYNANGDQLAANDDWKSEEAAVRAANLAPTDDRESAIVIGLSPGPYTAIVRGKNNTTGVALVQAYKVQ